MRALITGVSGFIGHHLSAHLLAEGDSVIGTYRPGCSAERLAPIDERMELVELNLADSPSLCATLGRFQPEVIYHVAGFASAGRSFGDPLGCYQANIMLPLTLIGAIRAAGSKARVLFLSSAEIYGGGHPQPLAESARPTPCSPYGASKLAMEHAAATAGKGLDIVVARAFNHLGPGQSPLFAAPAFARQMAAAEAAGDSSLQLLVGDLSPVRDFSDVRDVVRIYRLLMTHGEAGGCYNVGSGHGVPVSAIVDALRDASTLDLEVVVDEARLRPADAEVLIADTSLLERTVGRAPIAALPGAAQALLEEWRARLGVSAHSPAQ